MNDIREKKLAWLASWLETNMRCKTDPYHDGGKLPDPTFTANWIMNQLEDIDMEENAIWNELNVINQRQEYESHE